MSGYALQPGESYSLWVGPSKQSELYKQLQQEMQRLAAAREDAPHFAPHVTVLGGMDIPRAVALQVAQEFAQQTKKYRINFQDVARGTFFFQCVMLRVAKESDVMAAGALARKLTYDVVVADGRPAPQFSDYFPHLSLLYSDIDDATKEAVVEEEQARLFGQEGSEGALVDKGFTAEAVELWYTPAGDKTLKSWALVQNFSLQ